MKVLLVVLIAVVHFELQKIIAQTPPITCEESLAQCIRNKKEGKPCDFLPVSPKELPPPIRDVGYNLEEVRPGVYTVTEGFYIAMIVYRGDRLLAIDFPENFFVVFDEEGKPVGNRMTDAVTEVLDGATPRRIDMIYTHAHYDHIGGGNFFLEFVKEEYPTAELRIWGAPAAEEEISCSETRRAPVPTDVVHGNKTFFLGRGFEMRLQQAKGHSEADMLVYFPPLCDYEGVMMSVDVVFPGWAPFFDIAFTDNIAQYIKLHDQLLDFDFETLVAGHLTRLGTKKDILDSKEYIKFVISASLEAQQEFLVQQAFERVGFNDPTSPAFLNAWAAVRVQRDETERRCADKVIAEWGCRLAGVDPVALSHCAAVGDFTVVQL